MRSDWRCCIIATMLVLLAGCITYKPHWVVIPRGGKVKIVSGYEETLNFYDVTAFFMDSANVKSSISIDREDDRHREVLTLSLVPGNHTVLAIYGHYEASPHGFDVPVKNYFFIIMLDTFCVHDSIQLTSDNIELHFGYLELFPFFLTQESYTTELEGYLVIDSLKHNTLSGVIRFTGEAAGYYHSTKISDDELESCVSGNIKFTAVKRNVKNDSMAVHCILGPLKKEKTEN